MSLGYEGNHLNFCDLKSCRFAQQMISFGRQIKKQRNDKAPNLPQFVIPGQVYILVRLTSTYHHPTKYSTTIVRSMSSRKSQKHHLTCLAFLALTIVRRIVPLIVQATCLISITPNIALQLTSR